METDGKYVPLEQYLRKLPTNQQELIISFQEIERILNDQLPPSAYEHLPWWGNQKKGTHVEAIAWMDAGWLVDTVDFREKWVKFVRQ